MITLKRFWVTLEKLGGYAFYQQKNIRCFPACWECDMICKGVPRKRRQNGVTGYKLISHIIFFFHSDIVVDAIKMKNVIKRFSINSRECFK